MACCSDCAEKEHEMGVEVGFCVPCLMTAVGAADPSAPGFVYTDPAPYSPSVPGTDPGSLSPAPSGSMGPSPLPYSPPMSSPEMGSRATPVNEFSRAATPVAPQVLVQQGAPQETPWMNYLLALGLGAAAGWAIGTGKLKIAR